MLTNAGSRLGSEPAICPGVRRATASAYHVDVNRTEEERLVDERITSIPALRLRAPFRPFWLWWGFSAVLFPLLGVLVERLSAGFTQWLAMLTFMVSFFWSARGPMQVWLQRPKPVWLFFVLFVVPPFALGIAVSGLLGWIGL